MFNKKPLSAPRPPTGNEQVQKKHLATSILEHLIEEGFVTELSTPIKSPYVQTSTPEPQTELDH